MTDEDIPDVLLELYALGELADEDAELVRAWLDEHGEARLEALRRSNAEILERHPPEWISATVRRELARDETIVVRRRWAIAGAAGLLAAAAAAILWWSSDPGVPGAPEVDAPTKIAQREPEPAPEPDDVVRAKGDPKLFLHRKEGAGSELLHSGDVVAPGDLLQVAYASGNARYGVIASLDGAGNVSLHWPREPGDDSRLARGTTELDYAFRLDDAPRYERFFFVTSADPLDARHVMDALAALATHSDPDHRTLGTAPGWSTQSILLRKPQ